MGHASFDNNCNCGIITTVIILFTSKELKMIAENKEPTTIKVWFETRNLLKLIAATTGETMMKAAHRILRAELDRLQAKPSARNIGSGAL